MPAAPSTDAQEALQRVREERTRALAAQGLGSTILTGGLGASDYGGAQSGASVLGKTSVS